jgi:hypothetical protein
MQRLSKAMPWLITGLFGALLVTQGQSDFWWSGETAIDSGLTSKSKCNGRSGCTEGEVSGVLQP